MSNWIRIALASALLATAGLALASPNGKKSAGKNWTDVECFGYSKVAEGYACMSFSVGCDGDDPGVRDFENYTPPKDTAWNGHKSIALVASEIRELPISRKEYDQDSPIKRFLTLAEARSVATGRGYRAPVSRRTTLQNGKWKRFHGVWLRFDTRVHEGSASYQNHGSLRLSCTRPDGETKGTVVVADNQAERARAFAAPGARALAVGFVQADGGEGAEYYSTDYVHVDLERCRPRRAK